VTRFDRLARSTRDLLNTLAAITSKDYAEEALSVVHSLNLRSALGIFFYLLAQIGIPRFLPHTEL
jgi:DNA invertase Pin-like site-specific DNA recombinase